MPSERDALCRAEWDAIEPPLDQDFSPAVSVVLPVRDAAEFLPSALRQIMDQSLRDWELIIVVDGVDDRTEFLLSDLHRLNRIRIRQSVIPQGVAEARNLALGMARGEWVWFADVDDDWSPDLLELLHAAGEGCRAELVLCRASEIVPNQGLRAMPWVQRDGSLTRQQFVAGMADGRISGHLWNKLFRRELLGDRPFPPQRSRSDMAAILRLAERVNTVALVDQPLYTYCVRPGSVINAAVSTPMDLFGCARLFQELLHRLPPRTLTRGQELTFRYELYFRAVAEVWRYGNNAVDGARVEALVRRDIRPSDILVLVGFGSLRTALLALMYVMSPRLARTTFQASRRARWRALAA